MSTSFISRVMRRRGYEVREGVERSVSGGAADSRSVRPGDLFAAFRGEHVDGNQFVAPALDAGAAAAVCERAPEGVWPNSTVVIVGNTTRAIGELAADWRATCPATVVGVTGTVGKTTAKELIAATLASKLSVHKSPGNFNSREGMPLAMMSLRSDDDVSVLEMAMDSRGEIAELAAIAKPDIGVVINIGLTHVSKLGSIDAVAEEKLSLPRALGPEGAAVLNIDDTRIAPVAAELRSNVITFGAHHEASLRHGPIEDFGLGGTGFAVTYDGETRPVRLALPGAHVVGTAMAAVGVCLAMGWTLEEAARAVSEAEVDGRVRVLRSASGATILDDSYNSSPASLAGALRLLAGLGGRRIALIGEMAELGGHAEEEHRQIGGIAAACCDQLFAVGQACQGMVEAATGAGLDARWFETKEDAAEALTAGLREGDHVLVKASRGQAFESVLPVLEGHS